MAAYGEMRPRRPLIPGSPAAGPSRGMYGGAPAQPPAAPPPAAPAQPPAAARNYGPLTRGTPARGPASGAQNLGEVAQPAPRAQPPVTAAPNAFGVGTPTPGPSASYDQRETRNIRTSGAVRQEQHARQPGAPWHYTGGEAPKATMTPFVGSFNPTTPQGDRDAGGTPEGAKGVASAPVWTRPGETPPPKAPVGVEAAPVEPIKTSTSAMTDGTGESAEGLNADESDPLILHYARGSGRSYNEVKALFDKYNREGWATSFNTNEDSGEVEGWTRQRSVPADEVRSLSVIGMNFNQWEDPETGQVYSVEQNENGDWIATDSGDVNLEDLNRAEAEAKNLPATDENGKTIPQDDGKGDFDAFLKDLMSNYAEIGNSPEDKAALENSVNESRNRHAYETGQAQLQAMEGSARAGLSADAASGTAAGIGQAGGIAGAQDENKIRLQAARDNIAARLQSLQIQAAFASSQIEREAAQKFALTLLKEQARVNKQLMAYEDALNTPSIGEGILGFLSGGAKAVGDGLGFAFGNWLAK